MTVSKFSSKIISKNDKNIVKLTLLIKVSKNGKYDVIFLFRLYFNSKSYCSAKENIFRI